MRQRQKQEKLPAGYKRCTKCGRVKPLGKFSRRRSNKKDGHDWHCRACRSKYRRAKWRRLHPFPSREKLPEGFKRCTKCDAVKPFDDFHRNSRNKTNGRVAWCKVCMAEYKHQHHIEHLERDARQARCWCQKNPEKVAANGRRWGQENPGKVRAKTARYHARKMGLPATLTDSQWQEILEEWGWCGAYCGRDEYQFEGVLQQEHVIPVTQGGGYTLANIVPACPQCNHRKHARTPEQAGLDFMPIF